MHRWLAVVIASLAGSALAEPTGVAVEWYNTITGHYFMTSGPDEIALVDRGGAGPGWVRTGGEFATYLIGRASCRERV